MNCEQFTATITDYMEGRTSLGTRMGIVLHSMMCAHCRRYRQQISIVVNVAGEDAKTDAELGAVEGEDALVAQFQNRQGAP